MKKRIWELDALRGLCILGMVAVHFVYDVTMLYRILPWEPAPWFLLLKNWGGLVFLVLSGTCATLGSRSVRRGLLVLGCGMLCTLATAGMYWLGMAEKSILIYFGVLHCLGLCMLLWPVFSRLPWWALAALGAAMAALGLYFTALTVPFPWLIPLGLCPEGFATSDYFPLLPNLGYFLLGAALGKTAYKGKTSLLPKINSGNFLLRFLRFCGRHSLEIYLLHQPILNGICLLLMG